MDKPIDRLPPHALEAESGFLGCLMLDPLTVLETYGAKVHEELFFDQRNGWIWASVKKLFDQNTHIDLITLKEVLTLDGKIDSVGGIYHLASLQDSVPSAANASYYLDILTERYAQRQVIYTCTHMISSAYVSEKPAPELIDRAVSTLSETGLKFAGYKDVPVKEVVYRCLERMEKYIQGNGQVQTGITTGFIDLDKMTRGLKPPEMWVIAGRPSLGKTSLAMNIVEHVAVEQGIPVGMFSMEMSTDQLIQRMIYSRARVNSNNVMDGFVSEHEIPKLVGVSGKIAAAPLYIDDTESLNIFQIRARARRWKRLFGIKLLVLDYIQLVATLGGRGENRNEQLAKVSSGLKGLAKGLDIPIIVISQLNRDIEKTKEKNRKPRLSDLRECGALEQDADLVGMLYQPGKFEEDVNTQDPTIPVNLLLAKQRDGPTGDVFLTFFKIYTRFESAAKVSDPNI